MADKVTEFDETEGSADDADAGTMIDNVSLMLTGTKVTAESTSPPTREMILKWINDAYDKIAGMSSRWMWLRGSWSLSVTAGTREYTLSTEVAEVLAIYRGEVSVKEHHQSVLDAIPGSQRVNGFTGRYGVKEAGSRGIVIEFDETPDKTETYTIIGVKHKNKLVEDTDLPLIPRGFRMALEKDAILTGVNYGFASVNINTATITDELYDPDYGLIPSMKRRYIPKMKNMGFRVEK